MKQYYKFSIFLLTVFLFSCLTAGDTAQQLPVAAGPVEMPMYYGNGTGSSSTEALANAKREAVIAASFDLLGLAVATAKNAEIKGVFYNVSNINLYVDNSTQRILDSGSSGGQNYSKIGIRVDLQAIAATLTNEMILGGQVDGRSGITYKLSDQSPPAAIAVKDDTASAAKEDTAAAPKETPVAPEKTPPAVATAEEQAFIEDFLNKLTFMVYYDETKVTDVHLMKSAVTQANSLLANQGFNFVNLNQIESLKADQELVYEQATGQTVSLLMWIAQRLHADVYIELSLDSNSFTRSNNHYGEAHITLDIFESSTASGLGAATYSTNPPAFSTSSQQAALNNAVNSAVYQGLDYAKDMIFDYYRRALVEGIRYELVVLNTHDSRLMRDFMSALDRHRSVKSVSRISASPDETRYAVRMLGRIEDLEDAVYDISDTVRGLRDMYMVISSGNSITFDTGL